MRRAPGSSLRASLRMFPEPALVPARAVVPAGAQLLLGGALEQPAEAEDLRLDLHVGHAPAARVAERLDAHRALLAQLVGERGRLELPAPHLRRLVEGALLDVAEARPEQLRHRPRHV